MLASASCMLAAAGTLTEDYYLDSAPVSEAEQEPWMTNEEAKHMDALSSGLTWKERQRSGGFLTSLKNRFQVPKVLVSKPGDNPDDLRGMSIKIHGSQGQETDTFDQLCLDELQAGAFCSRLSQARLKGGLDEESKIRMAMTERKWCNAWDGLQQKRKKLGLKLDHPMCRIPLMEARRAKAHIIADQLVQATAQGPVGRAWNSVKESLSR